jgi:hypothetical protein
MFRFITLFLSLLISFTPIVISQNLKIDFKQVLEITDSEKSFLIGALDGIATDKNNNIYLFDNIQNSVIKLSSNGEYIDQIIRNGRGPSEINSIYSYFLDIKKEYIYVADRQNFRFMITDLQGKEISNFPIRPNDFNTPMRMFKYDEDTMLFLFSNSQEQSMRLLDGIDSLMHFYDINSMERKFSLGDRKTLMDRVNYNPKSAGLLTKTHVGEVVFPNRNTLLYSPFIYNKSLLIYKKTNNKWTFSGQVNGNNWDLKPFEEIDIEDYRQNRVKYRGTGKNESSSSGPDGKVAGYINLRSVGLFENSDGKILNYVVVENPRNKSFYHELYVEVYSQDLKFLDSQMIFSGKDDELIRKVYWKDESDNFYLATQPSRYSGKVIKFKLDINR